VSLYAQQFKPELICAASGTIANANTNISWTIGEVIISTMDNASILLTNGIAQPTYNITAVKHHLSTTDVKLFPNPANDILVLQSKNGQLKDALYAVFDINGKLIMNDKISGNEIYIDFSHVSSASYLMKITDTSGQNIQTYKIIKQ
jgi:hypothetical protein